MENDPLIQQLAAQALGAPAPDAEAAAAAAAQGAKPPVPTPDAAPAGDGDKKTVAEVATELASPNAEGEAAEMDSAVFEIDFGEGRKRQLNAKQIRDTFKRYGDLNQKWREHSEKTKTLGPIMQFAETLMQAAQQSGQQITAEDIVGFMQQSLQGGTSSFGGTNDGGAPTPGNGEGGDDPFAKWEEENSITLPPGFRESLNKTRDLEQQLAKTNNLLMQILQAQQGVAGAASQAAQQAAQNNVSAIQRTIANNLNYAQQQFQLPDEAEQEFFAFAAARGYTIEDFVDPELTMAVVGDFKNNLNSPEMERLRNIAQKRQAYTGSLNAAPSGGGTGQPSADDKFFNDLVTGAMAQKNR
jgi:hypothetical protein